MHGSLPTKLRVLRAERGLTLRAAEHLTGVDKDTLSKIERGRRDPQDVTLAKIAKGYGVPVEDLLEEPVPLGEAPQETGQPEVRGRTFEEFEQALARVLEPVRAEALKEQQASARLHASERRSLTRIVDPPEAEAGKRFLEEFSPEEQPLAFGEVAQGHARHERDSAALREENAALRKKLAELEKKVAQLEKTQSPPVRKGLRARY